MAYSATVTSHRYLSNDRKLYHTFKIVEAEAQATSEWSITVPKVGTIVLFQADITSGTGTTIQSKVGKATGWSASTVDAISQQAVAAAYLYDTTQIPYSLHGTTDANQGTMYGRSVVNAGTDNAITTVIVICEGVI